MVAQGFLIAGPTASGKSQLAFALAKRYDAVIINADALQVYNLLSVITACPTFQEKQQISHFLYNYIPPFQCYSVGHWLKDVSSLLAKLGTKKFVIVGGTGLYFEALLGGLAAIPDVKEEVKQKWRLQAAKSNSQELYKCLLTCDPLLAKKLQPQDKQRIVRALEIFDSTGKPLSFWQTQKQSSILEGYCLEKYLIMPERERLYQNIENRFIAMIQQGAIEEVASFLNIFATKQQQFEGLLITKAIGVAEIMAYLKNHLTLDEAIRQAITRSRQYAKRQMTWFRNRFDANWQRGLMPQFFLQEG